MNMKVSVIILNYNGEKFINNCIRSLLNQTYSDFEIIFIDNVSTDNSVKIAKENNFFSKEIIIADNKLFIGFFRH